MKAIMDAAESALFENTIREASNYVEFGSGGSTLMAAQLVQSSVLSIDSSIDWLSKVKNACAQEKTRILPDTYHVELGPLGDWGMPKDPSFKPIWPRYHEEIWEVCPKVARADIFFIDGRFRVACAMQVILRCQTDTVILFHDFQSRPAYHVVRELAREVARASDLSVFVPRTQFDRKRAQEVLDANKFNPN